MPVKFMRTLVKIGGSYRLTIPMEIVEGQGWKQGEELALVVTDGEVVVRKEKPVKR
jgi:bifunctional DNA-binding transcriptional regulator/antitoxin component of YhaV-PrlF toxin-antitoxin module